MLTETDWTLDGFASLGDGMSVAVWERKTDDVEISYVRPGHHTLSCYLSGGYQVERKQQPGRFGAPNRLSTLPSGHESVWIARGGHVKFVHLYFEQQQFMQRAVRELDCEPRRLMLADRTYFEDRQIAAMCQSLVGSRWSDLDGRLQANEIAHQILTALLRAQGTRHSESKLRGGLSASVRGRLLDFVDAHLAEPILLSELATLANLSEYHFARMFKASFGLPPHAWIAAQRIERARVMLRTTGLPLLDVANRCGYADASHFSHRFKEEVGATPRQYRAAVGSRLLRTESSRKRRNGLDTNGEKE